ncbi:hypothetical protein EVC37_05350 [Methylocaldum sp. BRCS4]|jgi:hypothetical protein|nr:hypothetical protein [Methylocaldum sp. BRCS4]
MDQVETDVLPPLEFPGAHMIKIHSTNILKRLKTGIAAAGQRDWHLRE